jgi:hypothetical protein
VFARREFEPVKMQVARKICPVIVLNEEQFELLGFIAACNRNSFNPTVEQVELWYYNQDPIEAQYRTVQVEPPMSAIARAQSAVSSLASQIVGPAPGSLTRMIDTFGGLPPGGGVASAMNALRAPTTYRELVREAESPLEHLLRLTWLELIPGGGDQPGLRLSEIGRALLRDREREGPGDEDVTVVVLAKDDPIASSLLMGQLSQAGAGLFVDPYLEVDALHKIILRTQLTRLLVRVPTNKGQQAQLTELQTYLDTPKFVGRIEVRMSAELHDRYVLREDGEVYTIGASLNGIPKHNTVMSQLPSPAREFAWETYERIWEEAELVGPPLPAADDEAAADDETGDEQESEDDDTQ